MSACWAEDALAALPAYQHMPQPQETAPAQTDALGTADGLVDGGVDDNIAAAPAQGNVLPWRRRVPSPPRGRQQQGADSRIVLLFDLNGTLTSHTSKRRSAGINRMRPGLQHLQRLQGLFRLGIFSSASDRTVNTVIPMLHDAIGQPAFKDRSLVLTRQKTEQAPVHHIANGGNAWDTVKPLQKHFGSRVHRIVLVDDDAYKACPGEERNMVLVPRWDEDDDDDLIARLCDALLLVLGPLDDTADVRDFVPQVSAALTGHTAAAVLAAA